MKNIIKILALPTLLIGGLLIFSTIVKGEDNYEIGIGPIYDIERDVIPGQLIVVSDATIYIVNALTGDIIDEYGNPEVKISDICPGNPQDSILYYVGLDSVGGIECSTDRTIGLIETAELGQGINPYVILQDNEKLFAICHDHKFYEDEYSNVIRVFNKSGLSDIATWPCEPWPEYALYDNYNNLIIVAQSFATSYKEGTYVPSDPGVQWLSKIGRYDPSREGQLVEEHTIDGSISGLAIMNDGTLVAGLAAEKENGVWASTLAIVDDPIEYVDIETYHVICMDYDAATGRVICSAYDYEDESGGHILVWDYTTTEYEVLDVGIDQILIIKFLNGKLYASNGEDNKLYVIPIDE